jgi:ferredoxin-NADP reductase
MWPSRLVSEVVPRRLRAMAAPVLDALSHPHGIDRYLEHFDPLWSLTETRAMVIAAERQTPDSVTLRLRPNGNWRGFSAGQFVRLGIDVNGVRHTRCYSPANADNDGRDAPLEFTIRAHDCGRVSQHLLANARPGMVVHLGEAAGEFVLPERRPRHLLLISGGSGITPVISMLRTLLDEGHRGQIDFIHYARSPAAMLYRRELEQLSLAHSNLRLLRGYSQGRGELRGRFSLQQLRRAVPDWACARAYVCGPPSLMSAVEECWHQHGRRESLLTERFVALPVTRAPSRGEGSGQLHFARSGRRTTNDGRDILDQAEDAGLKPEHGCRMGICHSCTCLKRQGTVRNLVTGELSSAADEYIRICISAPVGDVELDL